MPLPNTIESYRPELEIFEKALEDPIGARVCYENYEIAFKAQARFHQARALDRKQSERIYAKGDLQYGKSAYDILVCRLRADSDGEWWVYIERHGMEIKAVESLSEVQS